jgi:type VI secretion system protein ImpK
MIDKPPDDPGDHDRTVIRPSPGGARRVSQPTAPQTTTAPPRTESANVGTPAFEATAASTDPLMVAAAPLLHLLTHLRNTATSPDPGDIRESTWRELRAFERTARQLGANPLHVRLAHYALCASLDDIVLNMPWGAQGRWHDEPLAKALHQDDKAGAGFFEQLRTLRESLPESLPVIELMFVCLSLGTMGPYRTLQDGRAQLERVRHHVFELIERTAPPPPTALAPDATGVDAHFEPSRGGVPVWVAASVAIACVAGLYVWFLTGLNGASDAVYQSALAAPPAAMPTLVRPPATPPPPPPPAPAIPGPAERLRAALADLTGVEVIDGASPIVRVPAKLLFPQTNATIGAGPLLEQLIQALKNETGSIRVLGYTDSQVERSVAFPSNFALSTARAKAIRTALAAKLPDPARIVSEGRADADPVAPNSSAEGREKNRHIDIVLAGQP